MSAAGGTTTSVRSFRTPAWVCKALDVVFLVVAQSSLAALRGLTAALHPQAWLPVAGAAWMGYSFDGPAPWLEAFAVTSGAPVPFEGARSLEAQRRDGWVLGVVCRVALAAWLPHLPRP